MRLTQEAQVMPSTGNETISIGCIGAVMISQDTPWEYSRAKAPGSATGRPMP